MGLCYYNGFIGILEEKFVAGTLGSILTSEQDDVLDRGQMGVMLVADETTTEVAYSNFTLWKL